MGCKKLLCYFLADFLPISVVFVLLLVLAGIVLHCSKHCTEHCSELKKYVVLLMEKYFKQVGKKKSKPSSGVDISKVNFDDPAIYGTFLFAFSLSLIYVFAQLWDALIVRVQQDNCVDGLDCYLFDGRMNILNQNPLNCTDFAEDLKDPNKFGIFCYKYTFDYNRVLKDAGGALASVGIEFLFIAGLSQLASEWWYREKDEKKPNGGLDEQNNVEGGSNPGKEKNKFCLKVVPYHIGMLAGAFATAFVVIFIPVILMWPGWDVYLVSDITKPIQHFTITMHILIAVSIPWPIAKQ